MAKNSRSGRKDGGRSSSDRTSGKPDTPTSKSKGGSDAADDAPKKTRRERAAERRQAVQSGGKTKSQSGAKKEKRGGFVRFVGECAAELRKVDWPGQKQLISATIAVLVAVAVVGAYLWAADEALSRLVRNVLLAG